MPLSEEELRLLEQMERALAEEDPRFVSALEGHNLVRSARLRMAAAVLSLVVGGAAVGVGMWQRMIWLSVIGFVIMVLAASLGLIQLRSHRLVSRLGIQEPLPEAEEFQGLHVIQGGRAPRATSTGRRQGHHPQRNGSRLSRSYTAWLNRLEARWLHRRDQNL